MLIYMRKLVFRATLEEEVETLMRDINFLHGCLDDEASFRAESIGTLTREPTLTGQFNLINFPIQVLVFFCL